MDINLKINSQDECEEDEDDYEMHGQALPVFPFDVNEVDMQSIPLTSQEYLQQVIAQRAKLPGVVTASVPKLKINKPQKFIDLFREEAKIISKHSPSQDWQKQQISDFSDLRFRIECNRKSWVKKYSKKFPGTKNEWFFFMFNEENDGKILYEKPFLEIMLALNNEMIENLIKYTIEWVTDRNITIFRAGMWFFALLACIDVPLRVKMIKRLRSFVEICKELREKTDISEEENESEVMAQNLFICLIGKYFGQHDLSD